jgi:hypothetical protein
LPAAQPVPKIDIIDPILMILRGPAFFMWDRRLCVQMNALVRLASSTVCHSAALSVFGDLRTAPRVMRR